MHQQAAQAEHARLGAELENQMVNGARLDEARIRLVGALRHEAGTWGSPPAPGLRSRLIRTS